MDELISISERVYSTLDEGLLAVIDDFCDYTMTRPVMTDGDSIIWQVSDYLITETNISQQEKVISVLIACQIGIVVFQGCSYQNSVLTSHAAQLLADINQYVQGALDLDAITRICPFIFNH